MRESSMCTGKDKPSKHENLFANPRIYDMKRYPDCDKKRFGPCKESISYKNAQKA